MNASKRRDAATGVVVVMTRRGHISAPFARPVSRRQFAMATTAATAAERARKASFFFDTCKVFSATTCNLTEAVSSATPPEHARDDVTSDANEPADAIARPGRRSGLVGFR